MKTIKLLTRSRRAILFSAKSTSRILLSKQGVRHGSWYRVGERAQSTSPAGQPNFAGQNSPGVKDTEKSSSKGSRFQTVPFYSYFRSLKWTPIPLSLGFALLAYQHYRRVLRRGAQGTQCTEEELIKNDWEITCYRMMPWKSVSRVWGWVNNIDLPPWARERVLTWYVNAFDCDLNEAEVGDLTAYRNLGEFFRRDLKAGLRPVDPNSSVVSPADGKVLHHGKVDCGVIEQVKGVSYSLPVFLGVPAWITQKSPIASASNINKVNSEEYCSTLLKHKKGTSLYYFVVYLAPGDYHKFHSPADWQVEFRRHFAGELLSVSPSVAGWIGGLFSLNERAVYVGSWKHGFFSMTAVGATNVGSIRVYGDADLHTNSRRLKKNTHQDKWFEKPIALKKGDCFGEFNLGSTIVIVFEAPDDSKFNLCDGGRVRVGEGLLP